MEDFMDYDAYLKPMTYRTLLNEYNFNNPEVCRIWDDAVNDFVYTKKIDTNLLKKIFPDSIRTEKNTNDTDHEILLSDKQKIKICYL